MEKLAEKSKEENKLIISDSGKIVDQIRKEIKSSKIIDFQTFEKDIQTLDNKGVFFIPQRRLKNFDLNELNKKYNIQLLNFNNRNTHWNINVNEWIQYMIDAMIGTGSNRPIIFFVKGSKNEIDILRKYLKYIIHIDQSIKLDIVG